MSHSYYNVFLHIVFSTKNREPLITPEIEKVIQSIFKTICLDFNSKLISCNGTENHVHLLVWLGRETLPAQLVKTLKVRSNKTINEKELGDKYFKWQTGYGAFSVGRLEVEKIKKYIARQKEHHKTISFDKEYDLMLEQHNHYKPNI